MQLVSLDSISITPLPLRKTLENASLPDEILHVFCSSNTQQREIQQPLLEMAPAPSLFLSSLLVRIAHTTLLCEPKAILSLCVYICCCCSVPKSCLTLCNPMDFTFSKIRSNSYLLHQWCHPTLSSSVVPSSSCLQSFLASVFQLQWVGSSHQVAKVLELLHSKYFRRCVPYSLCSNYSTL